MNRLIVTLPLTALLGCSSPPSAPPPVLVAQTIPPPEFQRDLPLEPPESHFCQLGKSCMTLDPRPFEACLVGTKRCIDKAAEPLLVSEPSSAQPPE